MLPYVLAWIPMLLIAIGNGALRQFVFARIMPELRAHQLSTLTGAVLIGACIWLITHVWPPNSAHEAIIIGMVWSCLTVAFEFLMGLVLSKQPLAKVLGDYNLLAGRVWVLFLVWLTLAPWLFVHFHLN
jgi:hypothetical protein